ncbi:major facilitator superfamily domain-containing protein [Massariosphaeria phaeospora]|uniref:Major facilitator superfamily domain-containing protein n=1 Tax=Massariosphaeria phaeospora TaxID=100035 RepID=A0A7C8MHP0_9PLEO|nr:major facilitator superfamily domain-containing protein [Massariosphaeria phaeospora]
MQAVDEKTATHLQAELQASKQGGYIPETPEEKKYSRALNRKFDLYILPFCVMIYMFNGLDRSNLGNAQTDGFTKDLGMRPEAINHATTLFFTTFVPLQPFSAALGKRVGQSTYLGIISLGWGILTLSHAWVKTENQLIAVRLLIGVFEAGFYPTCVSFLSLFYPRFDLAFRIALFYGSYAIAGAFGGLIAYGCFRIDGAMHGWQYLFIIEGAATICLAVVTPFWLAKSPTRAWFLSEEERQYAERRMVIDSAANLDARVKLSKRDIVEAIKDWKLWAVLPFNVLASIAPQGFTIFLPIVIKGLGYSGPTANLLTVPPYVVGAAMLLLFAWSSDRRRERTLHILGGIALVLVGLILAFSLPLSNSAARYGGIMILLSGTFIASPITVAWLAGNTPEPGKRAVVLGINGWGNLGGIIGSELFLARYSPDYIWPLKVTTGLIAVAFVGYAAYHVELRLWNRYKGKKIAQMTPEEIEDENRNDVRYSDKKWTFVYGI